jgi:hypothetical protein
MADRTVTTLHGRQDLPDLKPLYIGFSDMPLVSISSDQRRPIAKANFVATAQTQHSNELAHAYLQSARRGKPEPIVGKFSQETLAEMIGTTRSRVSFFMNKFRKLGFIEYNGKLEVHNSLLNVVLYDKPQIKTREANTSP